MNNRGWRWRVLAVYPDAMCYAGDHFGWVIVDRYAQIGSGCTAPMAWRAAWLKIEAEYAKYDKLAGKA